MTTYPLSQDQLCILRECQDDLSVTQYNLPVMLILADQTDPGKMGKAIQTVLAVRKSFHIRFVQSPDGLPRQYADMTMDIPIVRSHKTTEQAQHYITQEFVRPFELFSDQPLCRFEIIETPENNYLLIDIHHIITDGIAMAIFSQECSLAYQGLPLSVHEYGLFEYAINEQQSFSTPAYQQAKAYYLSKYKGLKLTMLPEKSHNQKGNAISTSTYIPIATIDEWCQLHQTQSNLLFLAAFSLVLSRLCHQQTVAFSSAHHGRTDRRLRYVDGLFAKRIPIMVKIDPEQSALDFIKSLRSELMSNIRYGIYPFTHFCEDLQTSPSFYFATQGAAVRESCPLSKQTIQLPRAEIKKNLLCLIYQDEQSYEIRCIACDAVYPQPELDRITQSVKDCVLRLMAQSGDNGLPM